MGQGGCGEWRGGARVAVCACAVEGEAGREREMGLSSLCLCQWVSPVSTIGGTSLFVSTADITIYYLGLGSSKGNICQSEEPESIISSILSSNRSNSRVSSDADISTSSCADHSGRSLAKNLSCFLFAVKSHKIKLIHLWYVVFWQTYYILAEWCACVLVNTELWGPKCVFF